MLLKPIGPADETSSIMTVSTRNVSIGESTLVAQEEPSDLEKTRFVVTEQANSNYSRTPDTVVAERSRDLDAYDGIEIGDSAISGANSATETTRACLKRIRQALDQFEASEESLKSARQIAVSIEVYKQILDSDIEAKKQNPWEIAQIRRHYDTALDAGQAGEFLGLGDRRYKTVVQVGADQGVSNENLNDKTKAMLGIGSRPVELHPLSQRIGTEADGDEPFDPYFASVGSHGDLGRMSGNERTLALQAHIDDTVGALRNNIDKVSARGERLDSLGAGGNKPTKADLFIARRKVDIQTLPSCSCFWIELNCCGADRGSKYCRLAGAGTSPLSHGRTSKSLRLREIDIVLFSSPWLTAHVPSTPPLLPPLSLSCRLFGSGTLRILWPAQLLPPLRGEPG